MQTPEDNTAEQAVAPDVASEAVGDAAPAPVEPEGEAPAQDEEAAEREPFTPDSKQMSFTETRPASKPFPEGKDTPALSEFVAQLRETTKILQQTLEHSSSIIDRQINAEAKLAEALSKKGDAIPDDQGNPHLRILLGAMARMINHDSDRHEDTLFRDGSHWTQTIEHEGKQIGGGIPVQRLARDGKYSREELKAYVTRKAGVGGTADLPLWHSGIWLRFKAPSLVELTAMNQAVANIKVDIGSETRGLAFSNVAHYVKSIVVDFALQHVTNANVAFMSPTDLKELIDTRDIPTVILGIAATLYPAGYPYANPCIADLGTCDHITKELVHVVNFLWVDSSVLTPWQRQHMSFRIDSRAPRTAADIATYKSHHTIGRERLVTIGDMGFLLSCPTVYEHEELGKAWLDGIIEMTQGAFNEPPEGRNRSTFINQLAESTSAREYAHWVKAVVELDHDAPNGYVVLSDEKDFITEILSDVYSADEHIGEFTKQVEKYIDESLISMCAIPSYNCPCCKTPAAEKFKERFDNLIPIDPMVEFFTLASRKLSRIM